MKVIHEKVSFKCEYCEFKDVDKSKVLEHERVCPNRVESKEVRRRLSKNAIFNCEDTKSLKGKINTYCKEYLDLKLDLITDVNIQEQYNYSSVKLQVNSQVIIKDRLRCLNHIFANCSGHYKLSLFPIIQSKLGKIKELKHMDSIYRDLLRNDKRNKFVEYRESNPDIFAKYRNLKIEYNKATEKIKLLQEEAGKLRNSLEAEHDINYEKFIAQYEEPTVPEDVKLYRKLCEDIYG